MLTTIDNPYNPFTHFDDWFNYDTKKGHHSLSLLARITRSSSDLSEEDQNLAIEQAIEEIVTINASGMHRKVSSEGSFESNLSVSV